MAQQVSVGPIIALGGVTGGGALQPREYSDEIGPSAFWGGIAIPARGSKDRKGQGAIATVYAAFPVRTINQAPVAGGVTLATAGAGGPVSGTPFTNASTYAAGVAPVPVTFGGIATTGIGIDMGLDAATFATAGTATLTGTSVGNTWRYRVGQWIALLNGGASGAAQFAQITAINSGTNVLTVSPAPAVNGSGQISLTNLYDPNRYGAVPTTVTAQASAGAVRLHIPEIGIARGVGVTGVASGTGGPILIQGLDIFGSAQSEILTATAGATTVWGKKTYTVFVSATPQFTDATHNYTVKTSDFIGLPMSVLSADSIVAATFAGSALVFTGTNTATIIPADQTFPATQTTGDPRGGFQLTANGPGATPSGTLVTLNGTNVLIVDQRLNPLQVALSSCINPGPLLGSPPA